MMTTAETFEGYQIIGMTRDKDTCECCGRTELVRTVMLQWVDCDGLPEGDVVYFGTTCASHAIKRKTGKSVSSKSVEKSAIAAQSKRDAMEKMMQRRSRIENARNEALVSFAHRASSRYFGPDKKSLTALVYTVPNHPDFPGVTIYQTATVDAYNRAELGGRDGYGWIERAIKSVADGSVTFRDREGNTTATFTADDIRKARMWD